jgi:hypothetical protein
MISPCGSDLMSQHGTKLMRRGCDASVPDDFCRSVLERSVKAYFWCDVEVALQAAGLSAFLRYHDRRGKMIDWPLALSTASQAIKFVNELRAIDKEVSQAELKLKIADLTGTLADLKVILTEAKSDAAEKTRKLPD